MRTPELFAARLLARTIAASRPVALRPKLDCACPRELAVVHLSHLHFEFDGLCLQVKEWHARSLGSCVEADLEVVDGTFLAGDAWERLFREWKKLH